MTDILPWAVPNDPTVFLVSVTILAVAVLLAIFLE